MGDQQKAFATYDYVVLAAGNIIYCPDWHGVKAIVRELLEVRKVPLEQIEIRGTALPLDVEGHGTVKGTWAARRDG